MRHSSSSRWLNRFAWFTAFATLLLICSGGMVTSKNVGLAVPDWPTTFGYNMFMFPVSQWVGGVFFEHTHRLIASTVGFLTVVLAIWLARSEDRRWVRTLGFFAVIGVVLQGILGGLRVTMLKDEIGIFHACLAQAFLGLLVLIALVTTDFWRSLFVKPSSPGTARLVPLVFATTLAIYIQLALGATMRHQHRDLSIRDFPTAYGAWLPDTSPVKIKQINIERDRLALSDVTPFRIWLQMAHRFGAILVATGIVLTSIHIWKKHDLPNLRGLTLTWLALLVCQISLGAWTIWSNKAADVATTHVAVGATMLSLGVIICAIAFGLRRKVSIDSWPHLAAEGSVAPAA